MFMTRSSTVDSVIFKSSPAWNYLYFPDDGSNTVRHRGNQQFMLRGAQDAAPKIADEICTRLARKFEDG